MRTITGAILILAAEQAFAQAFLVGFPDQVFVRGILIPFSAVAGVVGVVVLIWGFLTDRKPA